MASSDCRPAPRRLRGKNFSSGNRIALLVTGSEYFPRIIAAIDAAQIEVHLESYIFDDDPTGRSVGDALARAAQRGVTVRLLLDGFGCKAMPSVWRDALQASGVQVLVYRPDPHRLSLHFRHLRRMHRKLLVIDGALAFCGGINITQDCEPMSAAPPRFDFAVSVEGPLVGEIHRSVRKLWLLVRLFSVSGRAYPRMARSTAPARRADGCRAAFVTRDNLRHRRRIEEAYLEVIGTSEHEILIACAYFLPGRKMRQALVDAVQRGVKVRLLLQGRPDHPLVHRATHALYRTLLEAGIELWEYTAAHLHAKVAVVDSHWSTVGSSNIDPFSLWMSREANIVMYDATLAATLRGHLEQAIAEHARRITPALAAPLPFAQRLSTWLAYGVARLLIALAGYAARDEL